MLICFRYNKQCKCNFLCYINKCNKDLNDFSRTLGKRIEQ